MSVPRRLGDFDVQRRIGAGGMAEVFLATKRGAKGTEKRLVIKRLLPEQARSERLRSMFVAEAHLAIRLAHPNLVHVYELADDPAGGLLLSMEYVDGADLARILTEVRRRGERVSVPVALRIVEQAARGMHYAHEYRDEGEAPLAIVHRDISPQNILISKSGMVKVADLGVASARLFRDETGVQPGKLRYMSPEQARGERVDRRCDIYALGVVLYELLRLKSPYGEMRGNTLARAVREGRIKPALPQLDDLPADVLPILRSALAAEPADRTPTARDLADSITHILFERREQVDDARISAELAPFMDSAGEPPAVSSALSGVPPSGLSGRDGVPASAPISTPASAQEPLSGTETLAASPQARARDAERAPDRPLEPGDVLDRYVIEAHIGRGGMADVFRARDTKLGREVALKLLRKDTESASRERLLLEAQSVATFDHPGSVVVYDVGEHAGRPYIAMELLRGRPLTAYIGDPTIPIGRRLRWSVEIARVLGAAHRHGLVHRDVKPSNVVICDNGDVKVLDFGIVRRFSSEIEGEGGAPLTAAGTIVGTPGYAAPEQLIGDEVDSRADQFGWAVTTYELVTGRLPWTGDSTADLLAAVLFRPPEPLLAAAPDTPPQVAAAIERSLSQDRDARFPSIHEAADALLDFCEEVPPPFRGSQPSLPSIEPPSESETRLVREHLLEATSERSPSRRPEPAASSVPPKRASEAPPKTPPAPIRAPSSRWKIVALAVSALLGGAIAALLIREPAAPKGEASLAVAPPSRPTVASLRCEPASLEGEPDPEIGRAIGIGACARLGVELGVRWSDVSSPHVVNVRANLSPGLSRVELTVAGASASGSAPEPLRAAELAAQSLAQKVAAPPLTAAQIRAWGAKDEASARRIARVFRRRDLRISPEIGIEALRLLETDADSPFAHLLVLMISAGSGEMLAHARARTLERIDRLPPSRQHLVRGVLSMFPVELDRKEAARLVRQSYAEAPDDLEMVSLYVVVALRMGLPEAYSVLDRLLATDPTACIVALDNAITRAPDDDPARDSRYAARWAEILPESRAAQPIIQTLIRAGRVDEARRALEIGKRLGAGAAAEVLQYEGALLDLELTQLETDRAKELSRVLLADPRPYSSNQAAQANVTSSFLTGRVTEAFAALNEGIKLGIDTGYPTGTARLLVRSLSASRWLGRGSASSGQLEWLAKAAATEDQLMRATRAEALVGLALMQTGPGAASARASALETVEAEAKAAGDDALVRDELLVQTVPLVRVVRGDKEAAAVFRAATHARPIARLRPAIDAALAFEAIGELAAAEQAYTLAGHPAVARESGLERVIASIRLQKIREPGAPKAVGVREVSLADLSVTADPGLIEAIRKMK